MSIAKELMVAETDDYPCVLCAPDAVRDAAGIRLTVQEAKVVSHAVSVLLVLIENNLPDSRPKSLAVLSQLSDLIGNTTQNSKISSLSTCSELATAHDEATAATPPPGKTFKNCVDSLHALATKVGKMSPSTFGGGEAAMVAFVAQCHAHVLNYGTGLVDEARIEMRTIQVSSELIAGGMGDGTHYLQGMDAGHTFKDVLERVTDGLLKSTCVDPQLKDMSASLLQACFQFQSWGNRQ
jgi:hypothetical protein